MKKNIAIGVLAGLAVLFLHLWQSAEMREESHKKKVAELAAVVKSYEERGEREGSEGSELEKFREFLAYRSLEQLLNAESSFSDSTIYMAKDAAEEAIEEEVERLILNRSAYFMKNGEVIKFGPTNDDDAGRKVIRSLLAMQSDEFVHSLEDLKAREKARLVLTGLLNEYAKAIQAFQSEIAEMMPKDPDKAVNLFMEAPRLIPTEQSLKDAIYILIRDNPEKVWGWNFEEGYNEYNLPLLQKAAWEDRRIYDLLAGREWQKAKKLDKVRDIILKVMDERSKDILIGALHNDPYEFARESALFSLEKIGEEQGYPVWLLDELLAVAKNDPSRLVQNHLTKMVARGYGRHPAAEGFLRRRARSEFAWAVKYHAPHFMK